MNRSKSFLIALAVLLLCSFNAYSAIPDSERDALLALYTSTDGANWGSNNGWLGAAGTECNWHGIQCNDDETAVIGIYMWVNSLSGTLPAELSALTQLQVLMLRQNDLTGIDPGLGSLNNLTELDLAFNQISSIPEALGNLSKLEKFDLFDNRLSSLPAALGLLQKLRALSLGRNLLNTIPDELGALTNLQGLDLSENRLSSLPVTLGQLQQLQTLNLALNNLSTLPPSIGDLSSLTELNLYRNALSSLPKEIGKLDKLVDLRIHGNQLTSIPDELGNLASLEYLDLSENQLTTIPATLGGLSALDTLALSKNQLTGSIPSELGNLSSLQYLGLYENNLTGAIPAELGNLKNLTSLWLRDNQLSGSIPDELGGLVKLEELILSYNQLSGPIPDTLANLTHLQVLRLHANQLSGAIPPQLAEIPSLREILLGYNALYTSDQKLIHLLDGNDPFWLETQTISPANLPASNITGSSVTLNWDAIKYKDDGGGYQVLYGTDPLGPYNQDGGTTMDKTINSHNLTALTANTSYYFVVKAWTDPHSLNSNLVWSNPGAVVCIETGAGVCPDDDGDGLPNTLDRDEHSNAILTMPSGEQYGDRSAGSGNTRLSSCSAIETETGDILTVLAPHQLILQAPEIRIQAGVTFKVKRGAELLIAGQPVTCP